MRALTAITLVAVGTYHSDGAFAQSVSPAFTAKEAALEYNYSVLQALELSDIDYGSLSDCGLALHLASNLVFNDSPEQRIGIKFMGLSGMFREAAAIRLSQNISGEGKQTAFANIIVAKSNDDVELYKSVLAKVDECNVLMKTSSEKVDESLTSTRSK